MMESVKKQKSYALPVLIILIVLSLFFMGMGSKAKAEDEPEPQEKEPVEKACDVKEHYKVYLGIDEVYVLDDIGYLSDDETIASVKTNRVTGHKVGKTVLKKDCNTYEVEVTNLITAPYISADKELLPCGRYTKEENDYLDKILKTKIAERGYGTRAAVVQAARFLVLQFPYHMNYFNENGRLPYVDGEGRYYHEGLYLSKDRTDSITRKSSGPNTWGCPIYCYSRGIYLKNSMDCSGFVSWAMYNGGFDPGDLGAGPKPNVHDLSDLGEKRRITIGSLDEIKNGDLLSANGHIGILIGIKDGIYYIAESNYDIDVRAIGYTKEELMKTIFTHWVDMDEFYGYNDGKMNQYWE